MNEVLLAGAAAASAAPFEKFLAVAHITTPFVTIYGQDVDDFTKLTNPSNLPANTGNAVAFYPRAFEGPI